MNHLNDKNNFVLIISLVFYATSLFFPAFLFSNNDRIYGWEVFLWGWWGVVTFDFAWFANLLFFYSIMLYKEEKYLKTTITSALALLLGLSSLFANKWYFNEGSATAITALGSAFYFWMASFFIIFIASVIFKESIKKAIKNKLIKLIKNVNVLKSCF